jgi:hypothetical protein
LQTEGKGERDCGEEKGKSDRLENIIIVISRAWQACEEGRDLIIHARDDDQQLICCTRCIANMPSHLTNQEVTWTSSILGQAWFLIRLSVLHQIGVAPRDAPAKGPRLHLLDAEAMYATHTTYSTYDASI